MQSFFPNKIEMNVFYDYLIKTLNFWDFVNVNFFFVVGSAYLAQSPQLYKQIALCGDFEKVFTIGAGKMAFVTFSIGFIVWIVWDQPVVVGSPLGVVK